jgi:hypothetical protein
LLGFVRCSRVFVVHVETICAAVHHSGLEPSLLELVKMRASQINVSFEREHYAVGARKKLLKINAFKFRVGTMLSVSSLYDSGAVYPLAIDATRKALPVMRLLDRSCYLLCVYTSFFVLSRYRDDRGSGGKRPQELTKSICSEDRGCGLSINHDHRASIG